MKKVVVIGGGTGLSVLLRGLKLFPIDITAIVSVADDGSSSGILRKEFNTPAVGDLRNVLVALSEAEPIAEELLQYRFNTNSDLNNHAMGNLLLTALFNITGSLTSSLEALSNILNIKGKVLPFTEDRPILVAQMKDGSIIEGESNITKAGREIAKISYKNKVKATNEVLEALKDADLILFGIGSIYTSIIPNLLDKSVRNVLLHSKAKKMYVCNAMSEHGETDNFSVSDCVKVINKYIGKDFIDVVLANSRIVPESVMEFYHKEYSKQILIDEDNLSKMKLKVIKEDLILFDNNTVRHDPVKTALEIFSYITKEIE